MKCILWKASKKIGSSAMNAKMNNMLDVELHAHNIVMFVM